MVRSHTFVGTTTDAVLGANESSQNGTFTLEGDELEIVFPVDNEEPIVMDFKRTDFFLVVHFIYSDTGWSLEDRMNSLASELKHIMDTEPSKVRHSNMFFGVN